MINEELNKRALPPLMQFADGAPVNSAEVWDKRRKELVEILCREEYGMPLPAPLKMEASAGKEDQEAFAGKAVQTQITLTVQLEQGEYSFPFQLILPKAVQNPPVIVHIAFRPDIPDIFLPAEEIVDRGFAIANFFCDDIAENDVSGFEVGLAKVVAREKRQPNDSGKIGMWAWAASRVMDYLQTLDTVDRKRIAVMGHSRLGKTALLTGALDERFTYVVSNDSGGSGAAITRGKTGEHVEQICHYFDYWFCDHYQDYIECEEKMPFDQHFLLAAIAPRYVYICSASEDEWADPYSEYLCCAAAAPAYRLLGKKGFICPDRLPEPGETFAEGEIGYHLRPGPHYLSRYDWNKVMDFIESHPVQGE